jgi:hypothetical protein
MFLYLKAFSKKFPETFVYRYITGTAQDLYLITLAIGRELWRVPAYMRDHYNESDHPLWWRMLPSGLKRFILDVQLEKMCMEREKFPPSDGHED